MSNRTVRLVGLLILCLIAIIGFVSCSTTISLSTHKNRTKGDSLELSYNIVLGTKEKVLDELKSKSAEFISKHTELLAEDIDLAGDIIGEGRIVKETQNGFTLRFIQRSRPVEVSMGILPFSKKENGYLVVITEISASLSYSKVDFKVLQYSYVDLKYNPSISMQNSLNGKTYSMPSYVRECAYGVDQEIYKKYLSYVLNGTIPPALLKLGNGDLYEVSLDSPRNDRLRRFEYYDENFNYVSNMSVNGYHFHLDDPTTVTLKFANQGTSQLLNIGWTIDAYKGWSKNPYRTGTLNMFVDSRVSLGQLEAGDYYFLIYPWDHDNKDSASLIGLNYTVEFSTL